jgi:hypothetical protein
LSPLRSRLLLVLLAVTAVGIVVAAGAVVRAKRADRARREAERSLALSLEKTEGHRKHGGLPDVDCASCHQGGRPAAQTCTGACHKAEKLHPQTPDADSCISCHHFALPKHGDEPPTVVACAGCHAGGEISTKAVTAQTLHGQVACDLCHEPHGTIDAAAMRDCDRCHDLGKEPLSGPEGHRICKDCHEEHAPKGNALASCASCHEKNVAGLAASKAGGRMTSIMPAGIRPPTAALKHESCASCHLPHAWKADPGGCVQCHGKQAERVRTKGPPKHGQCTDCHEVHATSRAGASCTRCHAAELAHREAEPAGHKDCSVCHDPHAATRNAAREACARCHAGEHAQLVKWGPSHAKLGCLGCHAAHGDPRSGPAPCAGCHADQSNLAFRAPQEKHRACASCHDPHIFATSTDVDATCASCHGTVTGEGRVHKGECKTCHASHGPPSVARAACERCHDSVRLKPTRAGAAKHGACGSCHAAHRPAIASQATCHACHQGAAASATGWPAGSAHAGACTGCHMPHDVDRTPTCASCHQAETAASSTGRHKCDQCHPAHKRPPGTGAAWWKGCSDCHAAEATAVKVRGPTHSECQKCHKAHAAGEPSCTSCHADLSGKGEHHVKEHTKCEACHNAHASTSPTPPQCLSCHKDHVKHHPEAPYCQTCHPFQ